MLGFGCGRGQSPKSPPYAPIGPRRPATSRSARWNSSVVGEMPGSAPAPPAMDPTGAFWHAHQVGHIGRQPSFSPTSGADINGSPGYAQQIAIDIATGPESPPRQCGPVRPVMAPAFRSVRTRMNLLAAGQTDTPGSRRTCRRESRIPAHPWCRVPCRPWFLSSAGSRPRGRHQRRSRLALP